ncbi:hypothetical protein PL9631_250027 [Planktothrix paucivesiculata PCC 9631]|uniref:Uncharacterized protein n=1 Tax=Planktothrix paucivesiculata PCC 9631 TaxID=671071 RepID=A0A7Z9BLB5_9CYAN|nr:hypothetical protein PL9631_250027 [Planktothrix paucivesiculata PCC 9631]
MMFMYDFASAGLPIVNPKLNFCILFWLRSKNNPNQLYT